MEQIETSNNFTLHSSHWEVEFIPSLKCKPALWLFWWAKRSENSTTNSKSEPYKMGNFCHSHKALVSEASRHLCPTNLWPWWKEPKLPGERKMPKERSNKALGMRVKFSVTFWPSPAPCWTQPRNDPAKVWPSQGMTQPMTWSRTILISQPELLNYRILRKTNWLFQSLSLGIL